MIKVPIGTPVDNTLAYLLDRDMMPVGKGKVVIMINIIITFIIIITTIDINLMLDQRKRRS